MCNWSWVDFARTRFMERYKVCPHHWLGGAFKDAETQAKWEAYCAGWEDMRMEIGTVE